MISAKRLFSLNFAVSFLNVTESDKRVEDRNARVHDDRVMLAVLSSEFEVPFEDVVLRSETTTPPSPTINRFSIEPRLHPGAAFRRKTPGDRQYHRPNWKGRCSGEAFFSQ